MSISEFIKRNKTESSGSNPFYHFPISVTARNVIPSISSSEKMEPANCKGIRMKKTRKEKNQLPVIQLERGVKKRKRKSDAPTHFFRGCFDKSLEYFITFRGVLLQMTFARDSVKKEQKLSEFKCRKLMNSFESLT